MKRCFVPEIVLGVLLACALFAIGFVVSSSFQSPPHQQQQQSSTQSPENSSAQSAVAKVADANDRIADYTYWLTWLTFLTAISTVGLWYLTGRTLKHSRETAERQLRAYVTIERIRIRDFEIGRNPIAVVTIRNGGQTPARNLTFHVLTTGADLSMPLNFPKASEPDDGSSRFTLGASQKIRSRAKNSTLLTENLIDHVRAGRHAFFVYGEVRYRDIFGNNHRTYFRGRYDHRSMSRGDGRLTADPGEDAST